MIDAVFDAGVVVTFIVCACELTIGLCIENVGVVSAKAELIVCTVLSAIAEFVVQVLLL